jgi:hypothetical protein
MTLSSSDRDEIEAEIERIRSLGLDELRARWRATFRLSSPPAFTKDLVARFLCWHIQEQAFGELAADAATLLDRVARGDKPAIDRRLKAGTVLVREYQGERHTVTVVLGGYAWRDNTYTSLSMVARAITGTSWNGYRFFGLEAGRNRSQMTRHRRDERRVGKVSSAGRRTAASDAAIPTKAPQ